MPLPASAVPMECPVTPGRSGLLGTTVARLAALVRRLRTEHWWLLLFAVLFLGFFILLVFQPTVGRGGR